LPRLRGLSNHTIHSYRDSLLLLLRFTALHRGKIVVDLDLPDLDAGPSLRFWIISNASATTPLPLAMTAWQHCMLFFATSPRMNRSNSHARNASFRYREVPEPRPS